jgi:hypothetical protein
MGLVWPLPERGKSITINGFQKLYRHGSGGRGIEPGTRTGSSREIPARINGTLCQLVNLITFPGSGEVSLVCDCSDPPPYPNDLSRLGVRQARSPPPSHHLAIETASEARMAHSVWRRSPAPTSLRPTPVIGRGSAGHQVYAGKGCLRPGEKHRRSGCERGARQQRVARIQGVMAWTLSSEHDEKEEDSANRVVQNTEKARSASRP